MAWVYGLISQKNGKTYIGYTTQNPMERLKQHNGERTIPPFWNPFHYTRWHRPWEMVNAEEHSTAKEARQRERQLKRDRNEKKRFLGVL